MVGGADGWNMNGGIEYIVGMLEYVVGIVGIGV